MLILLWTKISTLKILPVGSPEFFYENFWTVGKLTGRNVLWYWLIKMKTVIWVNLTTNFNKHWNWKGICCCFLLHAITSRKSKAIPVFFFFFSSKPTNWQKKIQDRCRVKMTCLLHHYKSPAVGYTTLLLWINIYRI